MTQLSRFFGIRQIAFAAILLGALVMAIPESSHAKLKEGERWTYDVEHSPLKTIGVRGRGGERIAYHYMTFKVTNNTGFARAWYPLVMAVTDTKKTTIASGFTEALDPIRRVEKNAKLQPVGLKLGKIKNGETLHVVAIFGPLDPLYDRVDIQFFGLINPITVLAYDKYGDKEIIADAAYRARNAKVMKLIEKEARRAGTDVGKPEREYREVNETRYLNMQYERLGDEFGADDDLIRFRREGWKVDGDPEVLRTVKLD